MAFPTAFSLEEGFILCLIGFQIYPAQIAAAFLQNLLQSLIGQFFLTQDVHHECHVDAADQTRVRLLEIWIHCLIDAASIQIAAKQDLILSRNGFVEIIQMLLHGIVVYIGIKNRQILLRSQKDLAGTPDAAGKAAMRGQKNL